MVSQQFVQNVAALQTIQPSWRIKIFAEKPIGKFEKVDVKRFYGISVNISIKYFSVPSLPKKLRKHYAAWKAIHSANQEGFDIYYTRHPETLFWSLLVGNKTFFETYRININQSRKYFLWRLFCYSRAHLCGVIAHSRLCENSFKGTPIDRANVVVAYNGSNLPRTLDRNDILVMRNELNIGFEIPVLCYAGRISESSKGSDLLLKIAQRLPKIIFLFVGSGKNEKDDWNFNEQIRLLGLTNVRRTGWVEPSVVNDYLQMADILLIPPTSTGLLKKGNTVLPIKTFQYLQAGRAIVAPDLPDCREILHHEQNALLVKPDHIEEAVDAIELLLNDKLLRNRLAQNAHADGKLYTWLARSKQVSSFLCRVLNVKD